MYNKEKDQFDNFVDNYINYNRLKFKLQEEKKLIEESGINIDEFEVFLKQYLNDDDFFIFSNFSQGVSLKIIATKLNLSYESTRKRYSKIKNTVKMAANIIGKN